MRMTRLVRALIAAAQLLRSRFGSGQTNRTWNADGGEVCWCELPQGTRETCGEGKVAGNAAGLTTNGDVLQRVDIAPYVEKESERDNSYSPLHCPSLQTKRTNQCQGSLQTTK